MEYTVQESEIELGGQKGKGHLPTAFLPPNPPRGILKSLDSDTAYRIPLSWYAEGNFLVNFTRVIPWIFKLIKKIYLCRIFKI